MIERTRSAGTPFVVTLALALGAALAAGCSGSNGAAGKDGTSCAITDNHDGTATVNCGDGGTFTVTNGSNGTNGTNGSNGSNGMNGMNGTSCTLTGADGGTRTLTCGDGGSITVVDAVADYATMTADEKAQANITAAITKVAFPADGRPVISLKASERHGLGVKNLSTAAVTWRFSLLKLVPGIAGTTGGVNGSASDTWVSYMAPNDHTSASAETAAAANLTDHGDGSYDYRFAQVVNGGPTTAGTTYEADKTHRLIVLLYASGNPFAPVNLIKELVPMTGADVTGQHESVDGNACLECHTSFRAISGGTGQFGTGEFHNGVRYDVRTCSACHNDQRRFSSTGAPVTEPTVAADGTWTGTATVLNREAVLDLPVFIHKIHMGNKLTLTGGTYVGLPQPYETTYPQDVRNCAKCHRAPAPLADHWKTQPSSRACGACHDNRSFEQTPPAARVAHSGGPQANDAGCATCHRTDGPGGDIAAKHIPVSPPNPHNVYADATSAGNSNTNAAYVAAAGAVPPGARVIT
jgi:OmcA/MtrC family decaheme c-type cytochrome